MRSGIGLIIVAGIVALFALVISVGWRHVEARSEARNAVEEWHRGDYAAATRDFLEATRLTIEGGVVTMIAQPFVDKSSQMERRGSLAAALDYCTKANNILGRYDDEDGLGYHCWTLAAKMGNLNWPAGTP